MLCGLVMEGWVFFFFVLKETEIHGLETFILINRFDYALFLWAALTNKMKHINEKEENHLWLSSLSCRDCFCFSLYEVFQSRYSTLLPFPPPLASPKIFVVGSCFYALKSSQFRKAILQLPVWMVFKTPF